MAGPLARALDLPTAHGIRMPEREEQSLEDLLQDLERTAAENGPKVAVEDIYHAIGMRSFGPLLFIAGLLAITPISGIPDVPSALGLAVVLIAGQMLIGRDAFWLPKRFLKLKVSADKLGKSAAFARKPARFIDRLARPRRPSSWRRSRRWPQPPPSWPSALASRPATGW